MSFQGQISSLSLVDVLQNLVSNKKTGTLSVRSLELECHIQFKGGAIISYVDNRGVDIARWLADKEIVPPDRMDDALRRYRKAKRKTLGKILRDLKVLTLEDYAAHLKSLVNEGLCEALSLVEGAFEFREGSLSDKHANSEVIALGIQFSVQNLIMEAARRSDDWAIIRRHLPSENEIYYVTPSEREVLLEREEDDVTCAAVEMLDGSRSLKQVIAKLPSSRFEAMRCLANLIARKKVRPLDSDLVVQRSDSGWDPHEAIIQFKTILEREPSNRQVLGRLANLYEDLENLEEAAKHHKILANSYLDEGKLEDAKRHLTRSVELNPKDFLAWQKLWDCYCEIGEEEEILRFGGEYLEQFKSMGFMEIVRDHLLQMIEKFPQKISFKLELAKAYVALGEHKAATQGLLDVGHELLRKKQYEEAEEVFSHILKYDHKNERARKILNEIQSGQLERRRTFRRKLVKQISLCIFVIGGSLFIVREITVQNELLRAMQSTLAERLLEARRYEEVMERFESVRERHPFSVTASGHGRALETALERAEDSDEDRGSWSRR